MPLQAHLPAWSGSYKVSPCLSASLLATMRHMRALALSPPGLIGLHLRSQAAMQLLRSDHRAVFRAYGRVVVSHEWLESFLGVLARQCFVTYNFDEQARSCCLSLLPMSVLRTLLLRPERGAIASRAAPRKRSLMSSLVLIRITEIYRISSDIPHISYYPTVSVNLMKEHGTGVYELTEDL